MPRVPARRATCSWKPTGCARSVRCCAGGWTGGQSVNDTIDTLRLLAGYGVHFLAVSQGLGTEDSNPMPRCMMTLMAALAEREREMIVGRVIEGVRKAQAAGKHCGRPRRVFRRDRLLELKAAGKSWEAISRELGVPVGTLRNTLPKGPTKSAIVSV